jgi:hypothetical protein
MNLAAILLTMLVVAAPVSPKESASIGGVVVIAETNAPAVHAIVSLSRFSDENPTTDRKPPNEDWPLSAKREKTDKEGRFVFDKVQPGNYRLDVNRSSNIVLISDEPSGSLRGIPVYASPGEHVRDLRVEVTPTASISGRILDRKGKPAEGVLVMAMNPSYENGRGLFGTRWGGGGGRGFVATATTNRRGEYRIEGVVPGQYYVANGSFGLGLYGVNGADWCDFDRRTVGNPITPWADSLRFGQRGAVTFFPGVRDPAEAIPIDLHTSEEHRGVDFRIEDTPHPGVSSMKGAVVDASSGKRAQDAEVWITALDGSLETCLIQADNGSFEAVGIGPGRYVVSANVEAPGRLAGRVIVDATQKPPKNLTIPVGPLFHVRGRIVADGQAVAASDLNLSHFFVNLQPDPVVGSAMLTFSPVARDGTFDIQSLMGWDYRVSLRSPEPNTYIHSIRLGEVDVLKNGFHLDSQPTADLEIVVRRDAGAVAGAMTITPSKSSTSPMYAVLVPDPTRRNRQDLYRTAAINEKGEFEMTGLPPGDYRIFAWERVIDGAWTDPHFLRLYEDQGTPVRITAGETVTATVKPIAPWR